MRWCGCEIHKIGLQYIVRLPIKLWNLALAVSWQIDEVTLVSLWWYGGGHVVFMYGKRAVQCVSVWHKKADMQMFTTPAETVNVSPHRWTRWRGTTCGGLWYGGTWAHVWGSVWRIIQMALRKISYHSLRGITMRFLRHFDCIAYRYQIDIRTKGVWTNNSINM